MSNYIQVGGKSIGNYIKVYPSIDLDAQAFLTASGITDSTITIAIDTLVKDLKTASIWTKIKTIYPFVGGSASTHKWNLKDPRDLDIAFRLSFYGGWVHSSNGALPNGINAYADTHLNTLTHLTITSANLSSYIRTNINTGSPYDMGNSSNIGGTADPTLLISRYLNNYAYISIADNSISARITSNNSIGLWSGGTNGSSLQKIFKNGSVVASGTQGSGNLANNNLYLSANNGGGTAVFFSNKELAYSSISSGLSDTEQSNLYLAVQKFQTTLNRQL